MSRSTASRDTTLVYAGFWIRVWAAIVDSVLVMCVLWPLVLLIPGGVSTEAVQLALGATHVSYTSIQIDLPWPLRVFFTWVLPAIAIILFWVYRSATPGKMLISATIVDAESGGQPSTGQLIGRYFGYYVSTIVLFLGLIWVGLDRRKQGWHDKLARTVVVRTVKARARFADGNTGKA